MAFPEGSGTNHDSFARQCLGGVASTLNHRLHGSDWKTAKPETVGDFAFRLFLRGGGGY
jgi:hypothetical protein